MWVFLKIGKNWCFLVYYIWYSTLMFYTSNRSTTKIHFSCMCHPKDITNVAMWLSIAHIPYVLHALMMALHMFSMARFIRILTRILWLYHLKFSEDMQAQMGEVRALSIYYCYPRVLLLGGNEDCKDK
jgi:hypothetical protein